MEPESTREGGGARQRRGQGGFPRQGHEGHPQQEHVSYSHSRREHEDRSYREREERYQPEGSEREDSPYREHEDHRHGGESHLQRASQDGGHRRVDGIDGLRAIAIAAIVCYHLDVVWLPSGHLGVVLFLVITGYLVTRSLVRRVDDGGVGVIPRYWWHRIKRVWPAMATMVAIVIALCVAFDHVLLTKMRPDILPALLMFPNLSYIFRGVSYFDQIGGPSPLTHLWYLGVDFQFVVAWSLLVAFLEWLRLRTGARGHAVPVIFALVLAVASVIEMGVLFDPDSDLTRVYYGTDTRAFAPLVGAAFAYLEVCRRDLPRTFLRAMSGPRLEVAGWASLVALVVMMVLVPDTSPFLYRGGMFLSSLLCAVMLAAVLQPESLMNRVLSWKPVCWLGTRSYSLYLWHYPLIQLTGVALADVSLAARLGVIALSLVLAEVSWRLFESSRMGSGKEGDADKPVRGPRSLRGYADRVRYSTVARVVVICAACLVAADCIGLAVVPEETLVPESAIAGNGVGAATAMDVEKHEATAGVSPESAASANQGEIPTGQIALYESADEAGRGVYDPVFIGDSVPGDAVGTIQRYMPDALIDTYVGRTPVQMTQVLQGYLDQGVVGDIVILEAFNNNRAYDEELDELVSLCGDRKVYVVTVQIPEQERAEINDSVTRLAERWDNVTVIDWYSYSSGHVSEWCYEDQTYLTPEGAEEYAKFITNSIAEDYAADGGTVVLQSDVPADETGSGTVVAGGDE